MVLGNANVIGKKKIAQRSTVIIELALVQPILYR